MKIEIDENGYHTAPDGSKWRVVPVEATHCMIDAILNSTESFAFYAEYAAAIKAAPPPPIPATRYDWSKIPAGYDWAATDEDGDVFVYSKKPYARDYLWVANGGVQIFIAPGDPCPDWRESLEKRPGT